MTARKFWKRGSLTSGFKLYAGIHEEMLVSDFFYLRVGLEMSS